MEHKTMQFEVVQTTNPCCSKQLFFSMLPESGTGIAVTRADAVRQGGNRTGLILMGPRLMDGADQIVADATHDRRTATQ